MDIPLRHNFTLSGDWKMLFQTPPSTRKRDRLGDKALVEPGIEDACANVDIEADGPEEAGGLIDFDDGDTSSMSEVAERLDFTQTLNVELFPAGHAAPKTGLATGDHMARTERTIQMIAMQNVTAQDVLKHQMGILTASLMDSANRAREVATKLGEYKHSQEQGIERLRRDYTAQIDMFEERDKKSQALAEDTATKHTEPVMKEDVIDGEPGRELYDELESLKVIICTQKDLLGILRETNSEFEGLSRSIEANIAELEVAASHLRNRENVLLDNRSVLVDWPSVKNEYATVLQKSVQTQDKEPGENTVARLLKGERSQIETENRKEQIYEMDSGELSVEAKNNDGSLHVLTQPVTEVTEKDMAAGMAKAPTATLQASGMSTQQQHDRLVAFWQVSSAYVKPIAGTTNKPDVQSPHQGILIHELSSEGSSSSGVARWCGGAPNGTDLQEKISTQTIVTKVAIEDLTSHSGVIDSCTNAIGSSAGNVSPETAIELATAAPAKQLGTEKDKKEGSTIGTRDNIIEVDVKLSHFASKAHILFFVLFAIWMVAGHAVLYQLTLTARL